MVTPADRAFAREMALFYRRKGFNPIPSATEGIKKPLFNFAEKYGWETQFPEEWFTEEGFPGTSNLQVACGRIPWRLIVIDLDGEEAAYVFRQWGKVPRTWATNRDGGHSQHWWFRLPEHYPHRLPKRFLWKGEGKHEAIERLCDQSLIVAPPSFHVEHRDSRYRFLDNRHSPYRDGLGLPAECPAWLLDRKPIEREVHAPEFVPPRPKVMSRSSNSEVFMSRDELLDRIPDKIGLAREWGVRFTGKVSPTGWHECHSFERPDVKPSAAMHAATGIYTDRGSESALSYFDTMIATGNALDFADAAARLMDRIR